MVTPQDFVNYDQECVCGRRHRVPLRALVVDTGVLSRLAELLAAQGPQKRLHLVGHAPAWHSLPFDLPARLGAAGFLVSTTVFGEGDLVPDEAARETLAHSCPSEAELLVAVGSGVVHDLTRVEAARRGVPFDSVPTAPSMDGFASGVAPILVDGFKVTVPAVSPRAIWADVDLLAAAPEPMLLAGVGDLMGKSVCLRDWELGHHLTGEEFCPFVAGLMEEAWSEVRGRLPNIRRREPEAIRVLVEGLVLSGMGMVMAGSSRPASGAEHHLSHFWELLAHSPGHTLPLHGLKVAAGTLLVAREVQRLIPLHGPWRESEWHRGTTVRRRLERRLRTVYGPLAPAVLAESGGENALRVSPETLGQHEDVVRAILGRYPSPEQVESWFAALGLDPGLAWLGVPPRLRRQALRWAPHLRNRYTVLRLHDQVRRPAVVVSAAALGLVATNVVLAAILWSAGVIAAASWPGDGSVVRDLSSRWAYREDPGRWLVVSEVRGRSYQTAWENGRWVTSASGETVGENSRRLP